MTVLTQKSFKEAVENSLGTKTQIAVYLGCTFNAVWLYCEKNKEFTEPLLKEARKKNVSNSSDNLYQISNMDITNQDGEIVPALVGHKLKANETILKTQGKDEGWVEKQEIEHIGNTGISINLIEKDIDTIKNGKPNNKPETKRDS